MNEVTNESNKIQILCVTLEDGRKFYFCGRAIYEDPASQEEIVIGDITISSPFELPVGYSFTTMEEIFNKENE